MTAGAAAEKRRAFALRRAGEALVSFGRGEWAEGLPKARAALELLEGLPGVDVEDLAVLCGGIALALAGCGRTGEALQFYCDNAEAIADEALKEKLLHLWVQAANAPAVGDLVQLFGRHGGQLVGLTLGPTAGTGGAQGWRVRIRGSASEEQGVEGVGAVTEEEEREVDVAESQLTLLTLRLSEEQRRSWRTLQQERPELFGERMRSDNEARWLRLFGSAARSSTRGSSVGIGACGAVEELGLPLEQTFAATLFGMLKDCLAQREHCGKGAKGPARIAVDVLGCRPALELGDGGPAGVLLAVLRALPPDEVSELVVRMCGPEMGCAAGSSVHPIDDGARCLRLELAPGLYHDVSSARDDVDLVVAMNAGIGAPQYYALWGPTLDLLARRPRRALFALTSYSPGELVREERMLRLRWGAAVDLAAAPALAEVLAAVAGSSPPWTLPRDLSVPGPGGVEVQLRRGDAVLPAEPRTAGPRAGGLPLAVRVLPCTALLYVGPNAVPGRSRNFGKLLLWVGGGSSLAAPPARLEAIAALAA